MPKSVITYFICSVTDNRHLLWNDKLNVKLEVDGDMISFEIDTGTCNTVIYKTDYDKFLGGKRLLKPDWSLVSYSGDKLDLHRYCKISVKDESDIKLELKIYVIKNDKHALVSRIWARTLKIYIINLLFIMKLNVS